LRRNRTRAADPHAARARDDVVILAAIYTLFPALIVARGILAPAETLVVSAIIAWTLVFSWIHPAVGPRERLLLVGRSDVWASRWLASCTTPMRRMSGSWDLTRGPQARRGGPAVPGTIEDIPASCARSSWTAWSSASVDRGQAPDGQALEMSSTACRFEHFASVYEEFTGKIAWKPLRPSWLIFSRRFRENAADSSAVKPCLRVFLPGGVAAADARSSVVMAVAVKLTSRTGLLQSAPRRHGWPGVHRAQAANRCAWTPSADTRTGLGPEGRRCAGTSLGASCGGPGSTAPAVLEHPRRAHESRRPAPGAARFVQQLTQQIPFYGQRHVIKRGLTGWAAVRYTTGPRVRRPPSKHCSTPLLHQTCPLRSTVFIVFRRSRPCCWPGPLVDDTECRIVNAMTIDVEDYFHVSVFDGLVPRHAWEGWKAASGQHERLLDIFAESGN